MGAKDHHKYIIVGGGTAGCVLANRLSEEKVSGVRLPYTFITGSTMMRTEWQTSTPPCVVL